MTGERSVGHPGLDQLARAAAADATSASRQRQLWWVAGELARALAHDDFPLQADAPLEELFARDAIEAYLALGAAGELRVRASARPADADTGHATRVRYFALKQLADAGDLGGDLPREPPLPPAKAPVAARPREMLRDVLADLQQRTLGGDSVVRLRMLAIGAMVADTGARSGELVDQDLDDVHPGLRAARVRRRPQGSTADGPTRVDVVALPAASQAALAAWLDQRARLVDPVGTGRHRGQARPLQGSATALWVSVRSNHGARRGDGTHQPRPAGLPLGPRGLAMAWNEAARDANALLHAEPGWTPLPERMDQLRRGVHPTRFQDAFPPLNPDAKTLTVLLASLTQLGAELAVALRAGGDDAQDRDELRRARRAVRRVVDRLWIHGAGHAAVIRALHQGGLTGDQLHHAGFHPALLRSLDTRHRHGRATQPS